jgi:uncharacterized membrane protein
MNLKQASTKVPTLAKVRERYIFHLIYNMHASCPLKENYHGFCSQWLFTFIPQWITVSPQRELSRILPSVVFHFYSPMDFYHVSLERTIMDFALNGFAFSSLANLYRVSSERTTTDVALSGFLFSFPSGFLPCLLRENYHRFCPHWLYIFIP